MNDEAHLRAQIREEQTGGGNLDDRPEAAKLLAAIKAALPELEKLREGQTTFAAFAASTGADWRRIAEHLYRRWWVPEGVESADVEQELLVSAWEHAGKLECVLSLDNQVLEGAIGSEFVRSGICRDLSMGYTLSLEQSDAGIKVGKKFLKEISVVKKGARPSCHIHGVSSR